MAHHQEAFLPTETTTEPKYKNTEASPRNPGVSLKNQTYEWFERTQRKKMLKNGHFADWFHGFVTRNRAEEILHDKPVGCFLIRFCESRVGFVLSYRAPERCRHFMLNQQEDGQYVIEGENSAHPSLKDLVRHYCRFPVEPYKEVLTTACPTNPFKHNASSLAHHNPYPATTDDQVYASVSKQQQAPPDGTLLLATSPKERNQHLCEGKVPVEYASPSFTTKKVPACPRKVSIPGPPHLAEVKKPSLDDESDVEDVSPSVSPTYSPVEEIHTYSEPSLWERPRLGTASNVSEPIAFYAVGRGSSKDTMENVYSEVDLNSVTSCHPRAAMSRHDGLSTLPTPKAAKHKATAFHSSFRSHKAPPQDDLWRGQFSRVNAKHHATVQLDEPMYAKGHPSPPGLEEENIYEKIPENCAPTQKSKHPGRRAR
ncbi:hypothetical protein GDO81_029803 [Engystomops pustulosus]|nr:hypothetical protein GDO81_029803 [Engystomops pustulosus]